LGFTVLQILARVEAERKKKLLLENIRKIYCPTYLDSGLTLDSIWHTAKQPQGSCWQPSGSRMGGRNGNGRMAGAANSTTGSSIRISARQEVPLPVLEATPHTYD